MAMEFNRIITLLRKERGITQKQAAQELGISQAQLSHYEKGIRECGLEFVVQIADYYNVSCDYLLGRSAERSGQTIKVEELPDAGGATSGSIYRGSVLPTMYKKLIENSLDILFDRLDQCRDKRVVTSVSNYLMLAVYRMFRRLYQAAPGNVASMFRVTPYRDPGQGLPAPRHQPDEPDQEQRGSHPQAQCLNRMPLQNNKNSACPKGLGQAVFV